MRDLEHRNIPPIEKQPYQVSSEYQALIDTQDIFCEQVRGAISLRNQTIVREIKQLAETKTTNPDFLQYEATPATLRSGFRLFKR